MTSSGIGPATFWLVAYCLGQFRYRMPRLEVIYIHFYEILGIQAFWAFSLSAFG
jgi:hypothetical protein